jgi:chromosome segregation and condensation protein ScpB
MEMGVLRTVANRQPIPEDGLKGSFGKENSRDFLASLRSKNQIASGLNAARPSGLRMFVTVASFLMMFDLQRLLYPSDLQLVGSKCTLSAHSECTVRANCLVCT